MTTGQRGALVLVTAAPNGPDRVNNVLRGEASSGAGYCFAGGQAALTILIDRSQTDALIDVKFEDLPNGVYVPRLQATDAENIDVLVRAKPGATRGTRVVTIRGSAGGKEATANFILTVE